MFDISINFVAQCVKFLNICHFVIWRFSYDECSVTKGRHKTQKWQKIPIFGMLILFPKVVGIKDKIMKSDKTQKIHFFHFCVLCPPLSKVKKWNVLKARILSQKLIFLREIPLCAILSMIDCKWQHYENKLLSHTLEVEMKAEVLLSTTRNAYHKKSWRSFLKCLSHWYALFPIGILGSESRHFFLMDYHTWLS